MAITPTPLVAGAPRVALPYGLFSVFTPRPNGADRWEVGGVRWEAFTCDDLGAVGEPDCDPEQIAGLPLDLNKLNSSVDEATSFSVYGHYVCSPIGNTIGHAYEEAVRHLELREEARVEALLWSGSLSNGPSLQTSNDLGELSLAAGVAALEQAFAEAYGSQGVIHMSRENAMLYAKQGRLEKRGGRLFTALDTPVVAGTGYGSDRVVITGQLFGYRSDIFPDDQGGQLLDRGQNNLYAIAMRSYLLGFDSCGVAQFTVTDSGGSGVPGPAGASAYEIAVQNGFEGTEEDWLLSLVGPAGSAATITVGNVTTGAPGSEATVTNTGNDTAAVLDFSIPQGAQGTPGADGADGNDGAPGAPGVVQTIQAGDGIVVDDTDPANPIVGTA